MKRITTSLSLVGMILLGLGLDPLRLDASTVIYVDAHATGAGTGADWANAYVRLTLALQAAQPGTEIWVADGVYLPAEPGGSRTATFQLINGVALHGGFAGGDSIQYPGGETQLSQRDPAAHVSILSGDLNGNDPATVVLNDPARSEDVYHVVTGSNTGNSAILEGFTITSGAATGTGSEDSGGGLFTQSGSPTVQNCRFVRNLATDLGGGVYNENSSTKLLNCEFRENRGGAGGGVSTSGAGSLLVEECRFIGNKGSAFESYTDSTSVVRKCRFESNENHLGGAVAVYGICEFYDCLFLANTAYTGGAIYQSGYPSLSSSKYVNCRIIGNLASFGGAVHTSGGSVSMLGCFLSGNKASENGGAWEGNRSTLTNCTIVMNWGQREGALSDLYNTTITNCIIWGNTNDRDSGQAAQLSSLDQGRIRYSHVEGWTGQLGGAGNSGLDPRFVNLLGPDGVAGTEDDDPRIDTQSPCIDGGDNRADIDAYTDGYQPIQGTDIVGHPRFIDAPVPDHGSGTAPVIDMGAHEFFPDCNGNTILDLTDIQNGTSADINHNKVPDECDPDCNHNGVLDDMEIAAGMSKDCNANTVPDQCDISAGTSRDCNANGIPEECELSTGATHDCNGNGVSDTCDIIDHNSDCNGNGVPDECDLPPIPLGFTSTAMTVNDGYPIASGDVDGDGNIDLVIGRHSGFRTMVLLNSGAGVFTAAPDSMLSNTSSLYFIRLADLNADHFPDLLLTPASSSTVVVYLNRERGALGAWLGFDTGTSYGTDQDPRSIRVGDLDNDNLPEIVTPNQTGDSFSVLWNMGGGKFSARISFSLPNSDPQDVAIADFDGDHFADVAVLKLGSAPLSIWLNNRNGTFSSAMNLSGIYAGFEETVGDWDGDGDNDLAVAGDSGKAVFILMNLGLDAQSHWLGFAAPIQVALNGASARGLRILSADFENDGHPDLAVMQSNPIGLGIWRNNGLGVFGLGYFFPGLSGPSSTVAADLNGDGLTDMAMTQIINSNTLNFLFNTTPASFSHDCNGNGKPDDCDAQAGPSLDCDHNLVPDECEADCNGNGKNDACDISTGLSQDCDLNGVPDECDPDCNHNGKPDACDLATAINHDCNLNQAPDECDIASGQSEDANHNLIPDSCEDCNSNGVPDGKEVSSGTAPDCNRNGVPDACDIHDGRSPDCDGNGQPDECATYFSFDSGRLEPTGSSYGVTIVKPLVAGEPVHVTLKIRAAVGMTGSFIQIKLNGTEVLRLVPPSITCCPVTPDAVEVAIPEALFDSLVAGGNAAFAISLGTNPGNTGCFVCGHPYVSLALSYHTPVDCNSNFRMDACDILDGTSADANFNHRPDECDPDCNHNQRPDDLDAILGLSPDCNFNLVPDECEPDTDKDGVIDVCDNCPAFESADQSDDDSDGLGNGCDNCPEVANPGQGNVDADGMGDACDPDADNDGVLNGADNCPLVANTLQADGDHDGVGDACDLCLRTGLGMPVDQHGCIRPIRGDFDRDGDVDGKDLAHLRACLTGANVRQSLAACQDARLDADDDVDLADFGLLQVCLSGANVPADVSCLVAE